jgi:pilus assembly protein CpaE
LISQGGENGYLSQAFECGVDDIVLLHADSNGELDPGLGRHLAFSLEKAVVRKRGAEAGTSREEGRLIAVLGLKGGSGKTLTRVNLGIALATKGHSVALLDLDLQFGDVALAMGLTPERTVYDLVRSGGSLDADKLRDFMVQHPSGVRALLAPLRPDHAALINAAFVREVLRLLRQTHEYVIVDTPPNFTPEVIAAVDMSSDVLMVATRDTLALKNSKLGLETLEEMGYDRERIRIVLNRADTKVGIASQDVIAILGREVDVLVPSHRDITRSVNQGVPITLQRSTAGKAFTSLAQLYRNGTEPKRAPRELDHLADEVNPGRAPEAASETTKQPRRRLLRRPQRVGG